MEERDTEIILIESPWCVKNLYSNNNKPAATLAIYKTLRCYFPHGYSLLTIPEINSLKQRTSLKIFIAIFTDRDIIFMSLGFP